MKEIIIKLGKIAISGILAVALLSIVCLVYSYNMLGIPTPTGASSYSCVPGSLKSEMDEGFGWNVMDANGYNNDEAYDDIDVLIMGGSHIEALQMNRSENVTHKLDEMLPNYHVYNVGTSGHSIENCAYYLDNACGYFSPRYVVIDLNSLELNEDNMNSVISGTYQGPELLSQKSNLASLVRNYIPASGQLILQLQNWKNIGCFRDDTEEGDGSSLYHDSSYMGVMSDFLRYIGDIAKEHDTQLILLYHPANYDVSETGGEKLTFDDETYEWEIFQKLCEENDIVLVSTKDEYIRMYKEDHVVPNGFSNTRLGSGHINKYGHTAMANVLYETIKDLED